MENCAGIEADGEVKQYGMNAKTGNSRSNTFRGERASMSGYLPQCGAGVQRWGLGGGEGGGFVAGITDQVW